MKKPDTHEIYLDSLRGIAVSIIILFHFNFAFFKGGYIGVDIFFVISGFLITRKIISEIESQNFSYTEFYANRIRRIFPALFILLICILIFGITFFDYEKFKKVGEGIAAIVLFGSNVLFWHQSGYFDNSSIDNSLLHTWSLAVEEQIYFILPLIIILSKRFLRNQFSFVLGIIAILSLILFCIGTFYFPNATFYFMPTRMWEFLTGSLLSTIFLGKDYKTKYLNILALAGLMLLIIIIYLNYLNNLTVSGSIFLSVISTAFIIISGSDNKKTMINQLLSHSPLIFIGKLSYSLYLWHWPVYSFFKFLVIGELSIAQLILCIIFTFILSYLSWYFIEIPFRKTFKGVKYKAATYKIFIVASFLLFIVGFQIYINNGFPKRFVENEILLMINEHVNKLSKLQELSIHQLKRGMMPVKLGAPAEAASFLIWGDSHALGFSTSLDIAARKNNKAGYLLSMSGTMPVLNIEDRNDIASKKLYFNDAVVDFIQTHKEIKTIFLACRWSYHFKGSYFNEVKSKMEYLDLVDGSGEKSNSELLKIGLKRTVQKLLSLGLKVVIINQVPEHQYEVSKYFISKRVSNIFHLSHNISPTSTITYLNRNREVNAAFEELASYPNVTVLRIDNIFKVEGNYLAIVNAKPLYTDNNHLSLFGLNYVEPVFDEYFSSQH